MSLRISLIGIMAFISVNLFAQKLKVEGKLDKIKEIQKLDIQYDYSDMGVGKFDDEEDYLQKRVNERNEKEPGDGDQWRDAWFADRENRFEPKFEELLNKGLSNSDIKAAKNLKDAPVTIKVHTYFTEPGFNVGVARKSAYINADVLFIDNSTGKVFGTLKYTKVPGRGGMGYDFDAGFRLQEAYAKLGKEVAKYLTKKVL